VAQKLNLVGIAEIAQLIGVSRQRVDQLSRRDPDFPEPVAELHAGRIWLRQDVLHWARRTGRLN
jgi:predicted DNA-binding transcriptional regulator AlpA